MTTLISDHHQFARALASAVARRERREARAARRRDRRQAFRQSLADLRHALVFAFPLSRLLWLGGVAAAVGVALSYFLAWMLA